MTTTFNRRPSSWDNRKREDRLMPDTDRILNSVCAFLNSHLEHYMDEGLEITGAVIAHGRIVVEFRPLDRDAVVKAELGLMGVEIVSGQPRP